MADAITDLWLVCIIGSRAHSDQNRQERVHCSENTVCHKHELHHLPQPTYIGELYIGIKAQVLQSIRCDLTTSLVMLSYPKWPQRVCSYDRIWPLALNGHPRQLPIKTLPTMLLVATSYP